MATLCTIVSFGLQLLEKTRSTQWPLVAWSLLALAFVLVLWLLLSKPDTVRMRFRVLQACRRIKGLATESIYVAAGDCSWLKDELPALRAKLKDGVEIRLLCRPGPDKDIINQFAQHERAIVKRFASNFDMALRCIIIDVNKPEAARLLLIDKERPAHNVFGWIPVPRALRRDHSVTYIDPGSKAFKLMQLVFNSAFQHGQAFQISEEAE